MHSALTSEYCCIAIPGNSREHFVSAILQASI